MDSLPSLKSMQNLHSVEDIQRVIERLQIARDRLLNGGEQAHEGQKLMEAIEESSTSTKNADHVPPVENGTVLLEWVDVDEEGIDVKSKFEEDIDISQWLVKSNDDVSINELETDRSFMDVALLNIQNSLVNLIKGYIFEETTKLMLQSPYRNGPQYGSSVVSPSPRKLYSMSPPSPLLHRMSIDSNSSDCSIPDPGLPVIASSPLPSRFSQYESLDTFASESNMNRSNFVGTPPRIDTRTYTRPKKSRMSLDGHLQATGGFNTLTLKKNSPVLSLQRQEAYPNKNNNLNETFVHEGVANSTFVKSEALDDSDLLNVTINVENSTTSPHSRQVTRHESYVVSKSPRLNSNDSNSKDLNSTFVFASPSESTGESGHNLSMEELHVMAKLQEQSLQNASTQRTLSRKETQVIMSFSNFDANQRTSRTSSTDTYSVGQSNPDSPGSSASGLSSPLDTAQSYDNLQGEAFRRSMPDLALPRRLSISSASGRTLSLVPPMNLLKSKPYHTSDTRLSHAGNNTRLSINSFGYNKNKRGQSPDRSSSSSVEASTLTVVHPRMLQAGPNNAGVNMKTGHRTFSGSISQPRYTAKPVTRPPSFLPPPGFSQFGAGVAGIRLQSRIPAPGVGRPRLSRPNTTGNRQIPNSNKEEDWRDGCY